jgi:hypothetical protein
MRTENIEVTGSFNLQVIDNATGKVLENYEAANLVVTLGRTNICRLLGGNAAGKAVTKIAVGTSAAVTAISNTALTSQFSKNIDSVDYPEANSVRFNWILGTADANGKTIQEFGLLNDSGVLFARKVRTAIVKSSAISLVGNWKITIN